MKSLILIDDSKAVNKRNSILIKGLRFFETVTTYSDSSKAFEDIEFQFLKDVRSLPDIIFLDLEMPHMDGFNFLHKYGQLVNKLSPDEKSLIVIVSDHLCEYRNLDKTNSFKYAGVVDHLKKPIDEEDIVAILEEYCVDFNSKNKLGVFSKIGFSTDSLKEILPEFFEEVNEDVLSMMREYLRNNIEGVRKMAHKIKGTASSFRADLISKEAQLIEEYIDSDRNQGLDAMIASLEKAILVSRDYAKDSLDAD